MVIVFGLGNPGREYENTYHNIGFLALDELAKELGVKFNKKGLKAVFGEGRFEDEKVILAKPQTYMNNSGESVLLFKKKFKDAKILVFVDDIDLPRGKVRFREHGSAGTHNGLRSIVSYIGEDFERIKIGIGRDEGELRDFVLSKIQGNFLKTALSEAVEIAKERIKN